MNNNQNDIKLLNTNPNQLVVKYQSIIQIVINGFINAGYFRLQDRDDIVQYVNEELLKKIDKIKAQYNGKVMLKTYMSAIIRNICLGRIRKGRNYKKEIPEEYLNENKTEDVLNKMIIEQEIDKVGKILSLYSKQQNKIELILKLIFRIPLVPDDFYKYNNEILYADFKQIIDIINKGLNMTNTEIFKLITPVLNKYENKKNSIDSTRRWVGMKIEELICLMNGNPPTSGYTKETFQILIEKYFVKKKQK